MMPAPTRFGSLHGLHRRFWGGSRTHSGRLMRTGIAFRRGGGLRGTTAMLAVLALFAAVLAPTASAQTSRTIGTVVLANGWSSADSAVASALAALESDSRSDAVVLYASRRELSTDTANFIEDHQPSRVILVGGTAALSSGVEDDVVELVGRSAVSRVEGKDRFDTAAKAVPPVAFTYIVANGYSPADTGVAAALAATRTNAAVLLATASSLTEPTERVLREQQPSAVEFVGGTAVLRASLVDRVREFVPDLSGVTRHSGASRTDTAAQAAPNRSTTVVLANGWSPADMGVAAAYAAITSGAAVLYSETSALTTPTEARIRALQPRAIVLVGGPKALDTSLHARLRTLAPSATLQRISGSDRIDTALRAADGRLDTVASDPPAPPTSVTVTPRNASLDVSWTAPTRTADATSNDDPDVTGYEINYRACTHATDKTCSGTNIAWGTWASASHSGTRTTTTISRLTNGTKYEVRIKARNSAGLSVWSASRSGIPLAQTAKPSVPAGLKVEPADRQIKVSWTASVPPKDGTVSGYEVEFRACRTSATCGSWTDHSHSGTDTTTTITGLDNGIKHEVRVQASSTRGDSGWSAAQSATPAQLPSFGPKEAPVLDAGNQQILVRWNTPADSGSPVTGYDLQYRACTATDSDKTKLTCEPEDDATWGSWTTHRHSGTATTATITRLTNGTAYQVQVKASNANGTGPWSTAAKATPVSVPAKPSTPTVEPGNRMLVVTWTAPSDHGSDIDAYDVEYCAGTCASDSSDWTDNRASVNAPSTRHEFLALTNDTAYKVRVRAVNGEGAGPWSSIKLGTPKALPDAPGVPVLTPGDGKIEVEWSPPGANGTTITGYDIQFRDCTATPRDCMSNRRWGSWRTRGHSDLTSLELTIPSLANGTKYEVRVRARISGGFGPYSETKTATPRGKPSEPSTPTVTAGDGELMLTWTPPADNGSDITGYTVQRCESTADCTVDGNWDDASPNSPLAPDETTGKVRHKLDGLTNGTNYKVRVRAVNEVGDGPWSSTVLGTPSARPDAPSGLTMKVGDRQVSLVWDAANPKGVTITGYDVEYQACEATNGDQAVLTCDSTPTWGDWKSHAHSGTGLTTTIGGLTNGTRYRARVRAHNINGPGPWEEPSEQSSGIPLAAASTPTGLTVEAAHERLSVSWTASVPHGSMIAGYVVEYRECRATPKTCTSRPRWSEWAAHSDTSDTTTRTISSLGDSNLVNGTKYQVRVRANSSIGSDERFSGWSQIKSATPAAVPDAPDSLTLTPDDRQISISWDAPDDDRGAAITDYDVEYRACTATPRDCSSNPRWGSWLTHRHSGASEATIITELTNGTKYQVRVRATNANGVGPWSVPDADDETTPIGVPAAPAKPWVIAGDEQMTVNWIVPRSNGSEISRYEVRYQACDATPSEFMVRSCHPDPSRGEWMPKPVEEVDKNTVTVDITGLTNGTEHLVQVRAIGEIGGQNRPGEWSPPVVAMPIGAPSEPSSVEVASGNRSLFVSWPAPRSNGSSVTGYEVRYCDTSGSCDTSTDSDWETKPVRGARSRTYRISGLANGTTYTVEVRTISSNKGESLLWRRSTEDVTAGGPNRPSTPRLTPGSTQITVRWTAPGANQSPIHSYDLEYRACTATNSNKSVLTCTTNPTWGEWMLTYTGGDTMHSIPDLIAGTRHEVRLRAVNRQGAGQWSPTAWATPTS